MSHSDSPYKTFLDPEDGTPNTRSSRIKAHHIILLASLVYSFAGFNSALADNLLGPSLEARSIQIGCHSGLESDSSPWWQRVFHIFRHKENDSDNSASHNICPEMTFALTMDRVGAFFSIVLDVAFSSALSDRWLGVRLDSHYILLLAMLSIPMGHILIETAVEKYRMQGGFFLIGLGNGLGLMEATALLIPVHIDNPENVAYWVSVVHALSGLGALLGPQLVSISQPQIWKAQVFSSVGCLIVATMCIILPSYIDASPKEVRRKSRARSAVLGGEPDANMLGNEGLEPAWRSTDPPKTLWGESITILIYVYLALNLGLEFVLPSYLSPFCEVSGVGTNYLGNLITSGFWSMFVFTRFVIVLIESLIPIDHAVLLTIFNFVALGCAITWTMYPDRSWSLWIASLGIGSMLAPCFPSAIVVLTEARSVLKHKYVILAFFFTYAGMVGCNSFLHWLLSGEGSVSALPMGVAWMLVTSSILISTATLVFHFGRPDPKILSIHALGLNGSKVASPKSLPLEISRALSS